MTRAARHVIEKVARRKKLGKPKHEKKTAKKLAKKIEKTKRPGKTVKGTFGKGMKGLTKEMETSKPPSRTKVKAMMSQAKRLKSKVTHVGRVRRKHHEEYEDLSA